METKGDCQFDIEELPDRFIWILGTKANKMTRCKKKLLKSLTSIMNFYKLICQHYVKVLKCAMKVLLTHGRSSIEVLI